MSSFKQYINSKRNIFRSTFFQFSLVLLCLLELRVEIRLLIENFTFTALFYAIYEHPLAVIVLLLIPRIRLKSE